jgi:hypothetical protein
MNTETSLVVEVWNIIRDNIPVARKHDMSLSLLRIFHEHGFEAREIAEIVDEDNYLATAYKEIFEEELDEIDPELEDE